MERASAAHTNCHAIGIIASRLLNVLVLCSVLFVLQFYEFFVALSLYALKSKSCIQVHHVQAYNKNHNGLDLAVLRLSTTGSTQGSTEGVVVATL